MRTIRIRLSCSLLIGAVGAANAYEPLTHADITASAVAASQLAKDPKLLQALGIEETQKFPNGKGVNGTVAEIVQDGARFEDDGIRAGNHFYDPLNPERVPAPIFTVSPKWAIDGEGDADTIKFSFRAARSYMFDALTDRVASFREQRFGLMFRSIGHVVHHLQDMAQPQHTRSDVHCDIELCKFIGQFAPSLYEKFSVRPEVRSTLTLTGYAAVYGGEDRALSSPMMFWHTADGKGIADYTNRGFVSARTNFDRPGLYPSPVYNPANESPGDLAELCSAEAAAGRPCDNPDASGVITFHGTEVEDRLRPLEWSFNTRTSSSSIFDPDLVNAGLPPTFSLNRFNFYAAHDLLIPRAVGYSAGMINYFFRGKIDLVPDPSPPDGNPRFLIQNLGTEPMNGTFEIYYDAADGNRYPVRDANRQELRFQTTEDLLPGQNLPIAAFAAPTEPAPKLPLTYMLVFRGSMGEEKAAPGEIGAVAAKLVTARAGGLYLLGEDASGNPVTMKVDGKGLRVIRGFDATGAFVQDDKEFDPFENGVPTQNPSRVVPQAHQMKQVTFQPLVTGDFSYNVVSVSVGDATAPVINGLVSPSTPLAYVFDSSQNRYVPKGSGVSWLATSPLGEFTFSLAPNFAADGGTLRFTRKFKDASGIEQMTTGEVVLPPLTFPFSHGDYNGFQFGSLVVSGDGLKLSGLKPASPVGDSSRIDHSHLVISLSDPPTLSLAGDGSTLHTLRENVTIRNTRIPQSITRNGTTLVLCTNIDSEAVNVLLSSSEKFYVGYINNVLQTYTRTIEDAKGGYQVETVECSVSVQDVPFPPPEDRQAVVGSVTTANAGSSGNSARFGFSFQEGGLSFDNLTANDFANTCSQEIALGALVYDSQTRLGFVGGTPVRNCTPSTVVRRDSITTLVRAITSKADHALTTFQGESAPSPATLRFRGVDLGVREYVGDSSPVGELFFATSDLSTVIHEPRTGGAMPRIQRGDIPANVVKLLAVIWL